MPETPIFRKTGTLIYDFEISCDCHLNFLRCKCIFMQNHHSYTLYTCSMFGPY
jgi:hypothetical protein